MLRASIRSVRVLSGRPSAARSVGFLSRVGANITQSFMCKSGCFLIDVFILQRCYASERSSPSRDARTKNFPKKKGFFRRLRIYFYTAIFLGGSLYAGGIYYARINDTFHDLFTQYVPGAERSIMYLEELEFQKQQNAYRDAPDLPRDTGSMVTIAPQSGASWRVADGAETSTNARPLLKEKAAEINSAPVPTSDLKTDEAKPEPPQREAQSAVEEPSDTPLPVILTPPPVIPFRVPEVDEPSRMPPAAPIDPLSVNNAAEPVVQELVRMLNDLITVANADNSDGRLSSSFEKAKNHIGKVGQQIQTIKKAADDEADKKVKMYVDMIDKKAKDLEAATESAMLALEVRHKAETAEEMEQLRSSFEDRLRVMTERERKLNEERIANVLRQQAVELTHQFAKDVNKQVEAERESRLGRLEKLSAAVQELEKLAVDWNDVLDTNILTQQLHVAVEAIRASIADTAHPRPFVRELVALKEIASDNPVVDAAIASINPLAYQQGISSTSLLIDRFRRVAAEARKASLLPDGAGVASHASSLVLSHLMFRKQGLVSGDDVESILTRTQTLLEEGDLDGAAREMNGLTGWAKTLSRDWLDEVRRVLEVQQALEVSGCPFFES